jgi:fructose-1,6-bisphosphatase/inositol monophosphatase family enzyme
VALEENGVVVAGAINCPATGDFLIAARGHGCWHNGSRTSVSATATFATATILTTDSRFRAHPKRFENWTALGSQVAIARAWGDCYGYVLVATGRAELMVDDRMSPWDVAALIPVIEEAGGVFTDWQGRPGIGPDAIATNATLARPFRDALGVSPSDI